MLTLVFIFPFLAAISFFILPCLKNILKPFAIIMSLMPLIFLITSNKELIENPIHYLWISPLSIYFHLEIDPLSQIFIYLTAIIIPFSLMAFDAKKSDYNHVFYSLVLLLQGLLIGFFSAKDLALFTFFWEAMLLPLYFMIHLWGSLNSQKVAMKFLLYMLTGSILMILAVVSLYFIAATFNLNELEILIANQSSVNKTFLEAIFLIFLLAFAVKVPLFPFHGWLKEVYVQSSTATTILLAALLSKAGVYGIIRIGIGLFPYFMMKWSPFLIIFAITGVLYSALVALKQSNFKALFAYTSLSHVNFILVGLFVWQKAAHIGAILQSFNHAITITALFLSLSWLEKRVFSQSMLFLSGLAKFIPHLAWLTLFFILSSIALPGTNNFIGEFLIFFGLFNSHPIATAILAITIILSVIYHLKFMQKVYFEAPNYFKTSYIDLKKTELFIALPLIFLILSVGIYPTPLLTQIDLALIKMTNSIDKEGIRAL